MSRSIALIFVLFLTVGTAAAQQPEVVLQRLMRMTPQQRQTALAKLPAVRRQQLQEKLKNYGQLPAPAQKRLLDRQEKLRAMPPEKRQEVRQALQRFTGLAPARKKLIRAEVEHIRGMSPEERDAYMNGKEFLKRFPQPAGQRMVANLVDILPEPGEQDNAKR